MVTRIIKKILVLFFLFSPFVYSWEGARFLSMIPPFPFPRVDVQVSPVFLNPIPLFYLPDQGSVVAVSPQGGIRIFRPEGILLRSFFSGERIETSGIAFENSFFFINTEGRFYRLSLATFTPLEIRDGLPVAVGNACAVEDALYWKDAEGGVFATSLTGEILFRFEGLARDRTAIRGGGGILCLPERGEILVLTTSGKVLWLKDRKVVHSATLPVPVDEGFGTKIFFDPEGDEAIFCGVRKFCFRFLYSSGELKEKIGDSGSLDGFHRQKGRFYLLTSEGTLLVWDRNRNLLKREPLFLEGGWLLFPDHPQISERKNLPSTFKFWVITPSGKLYQIQEDSQKLSFSSRQIARIFPGVYSPGILFSDGIYWVPSGYGSIYRMELR